MQTEICSLEEKQDALKRALESHTFARSEQLKAFLRYVCEAETLRPGAPLTEYVIGVEVLGRAEGYSPAEDSSVRTRAYELRQKLDRLYTRELPDEPVQITVPKGTYSPQYIRHAASPLENISTISLPHSEPVSYPQVLHKAEPRKAWFIVAAVLLVALLASALIRHGSLSAAPASGVDPVLTEAWGPLAEHDGTVVLCLATPLTLVVGPKTHAVYGSKDYPVPDEAYSLFPSHRPLTEGQELGLTFTDNMVGFGTLNAALTAAKTLRNFGTSFQVLPERVATVSALRGRNAILFGAPVDSESVSLAMADMPLTIDFEASLREFVVRDKTNGTFIAPKKGPNGEFTEVFGLLTVTTINDVDKRRLQSVVFSGITSVGVQGAAEFFSSAATMSKLRALLLKEGKTAFPPSYQVVVKCTYTNLLLLSFDYYSHRIAKITS